MRYRLIDVRVWIDERFRALTPLQPSGQALFLYLLCNPNTTSIPGLYRAGAAAMAEELGWPIEGFHEAFREVIQQGLAEADFESRVIFIPNAIKYNKPQSANVIKSWASHWDEIPECALKSIAYQKLKGFIDGMGKAFIDAFVMAIKKPQCMAMPNQEQDQEQDQEKNLCETLQVSPAVVSMDKALAGPPNFSSEITEVFTHWQTMMNHPRAKLDGKRQRKIAQALELGYSATDLKQAIDGCASTPFNMGQNDRNQRYDGLELILRDAEHIERFIQNAIQPPIAVKPNDVCDRVFQGGF